jgi:hypothetical protein
MAFKKRGRSSYRRRAPYKRSRTSSAIPRPKPEVYSLDRTWKTRALCYSINSSTGPEPPLNLPRFATHHPYGAIRNGVTNDSTSLNASGSGIAVQVIPPPVQGTGAHAVRGNQYYQKSLTAKVVVDYQQCALLGHVFEYRIIAGYWNCSRFGELLSTLTENQPELSSLETAQQQIDWWFQTGRNMVDGNGIEYPPIIAGPDFRMTQREATALRIDNNDATTLDPITGQPVVPLIQGVNEVPTYTVDSSTVRIRAALYKFRKYIDVRYDKLVHKKPTTRLSVRTEGALHPTDILGGDATFDDTNHRTTDVHNINFGSGYKQVFCSDRIGPFSWNRTDIATYNLDATGAAQIAPIGAQAMAAAQVQVSGLPNVYAPDEPIPFVSTVFLEQAFLNTRNFGSGESLFNEIAPRGPRSPVAVMDIATGVWDWAEDPKANYPWIWSNFHASEEPLLPPKDDPGPAPLWPNNEICYQPTVSMSTKLRFIDN